MAKYTKIVTHYKWRSLLAVYTRHQCDRLLMMARLMVTEVNVVAGCV